MSAVPLVRPWVLDNLFLGIVILLACYVGIQSRMIFSLASIWPANAILLSFVLLRAQSVTALTWIVAAAAYVIADLTTGAPVNLALILNGANMVGVLVGAALARVLTRETLTLARPDDAIIIIFIMTCASVATAMAGAIIGPTHFNMDASHSFMVWLAAELVNYAIYLPVLLAANIGTTRRLRFFSANANQRNNQYAALACAFLLVGFMVLIGGPGSPNYVIPGLIWCAIVFRAFAAAAISAIIITFMLIAAPLGGIDLGYDLTDADALTSFRLSIAMIAIGTLAITIINSGWRTAHHNLEQLANQDSLTGLLNRGGTIEVLNNAVYRATPFCLIMGDIDHFKTINDTFGHNVGDDVLRNVGFELREGLGRNEGAGRIGGEEFAIVINGTLENAVRHAESIRKRLLGVEVFDAVEKPVPFTMSFGVAEFGPGADSVEMLRRADNALYLAKRTGRDRVVAFTEEIKQMVNSPVPDRRHNR
ncbi:diguanylate cyclase [Devosia sp. WQ 349]|nr:diguanylate cyclase [Devosia sp. WQ 349K1]